MDAPLSGNFSELLLDSKVTALASVSNGSLLLVGVGANVEIVTRCVANSPKDRRRQDCRRSIQKRVLRHSVVHGFAKLSDSRKILVRGGKELVLAEIACDSGRTFPPSLSIHHRWELPDWIIDCRSDGGDVVVLTAHNRVIKVNLKAPYDQFPVLREIVCVEKCILYSGYLSASDHLVEDAVIALSGTVFQEVLIWWPRNDGHECKVLHRLRGHEGVIFSVCYNKDRQLVASTSDDRTARLWRIQFDSNRPGDWNSSSAFPHLVLRDGHSARVFCGIFLPKDGGFVTGGEDSKVILWDDSSGTKLNERRAALGEGAIWSLEVGQEYDEDNDESHIVVYSGGEDASVTRWCPAMRKNSRDTSTLDPVQPFWMSSEDDSDYPTVLKSTSFEEIFCVTHRGCVYRLVDRHPEVLFHDKRLESYCLLELCQTYIILGTISGSILIYNRRSFEAQILHDLKLFAGKVFSLHILNDLEALVCGPKGQLNVLNLRHAEVTTKLVLPKTGDQHWPSCACLMTEEEFVLVGDRSGYLFVFDRRAQSIVTKVRAHGRHGVGDLRLLPSTSVIQTMGRDGMINLYECKDGELREVNRNRMGDLSWGEKFLQLDKEDDSLLLGFHSINFVVHSQRHHKTLVKIPCGGGHRQWTFVMAEDRKSAKFAFIKDKRIYMAEKISLFKESRVIRAGGLHSKTICALRHFALDRRNFLATGGEDATIKLWEIFSGEDDHILERKLMTTLRSHISSVKCLKTVSARDNNDAVLLVSAGGRAQLKVWRVCLLQSVCEQGNDHPLIVRELASHMLKGSDKRRKKAWRDIGIVHDAEVRYTDLAILLRDDDETSLEVFVGCSDGVLRVFLPRSSDSRTANCLDIVEESQPVGHCFLRVEAVENNHDVDIVTGGTDGILRAWTRQKRNLELLWQIQTNLCGINAVASIDLGYGGGAFVTGDDGGSLVIYDDDTGKLRRTSCCHASQITGVSVLGKKDDHHRVISSSVDQRITEWKTRGQQGDDLLEKTREICCSVADAQAMVHWQEPRTKSTMIAVVGEGLVIFSLP